MTRNAILITLAFMMILPQVSQAQLAASKPALEFGQMMSIENLGEEGFSLLDREKKKKKRKKKLLEARHNTLGVGLVGGDPLGLGARGIFRIGQFGISGDFAYNRIRDDDGDKLGALGMKTDFRFYTKDPLMQILRAYTFVGLTSHRAMFNGQKYESAYLIDGGFGAGVKLFRLEVAAEAGVLIPARQLDNYRPGLGAFVNASVVMWLF